MTRESNLVSELSVAWFSFELVDVKMVPVDLGACVEALGTYLTRKGLFASVCSHVDPMLHLVNELLVTHLTCVLDTTRAVAWQRRQINNPSPTPLLFLRHHHNLLWLLCQQLLLLCDRLLLLICDLINQTGDLFARHRTKNSFCQS